MFLIVLRFVHPSCAPSSLLRDRELPDPSLKNPIISPRVARDPLAYLPSLHVLPTSSQPPALYRIVVFRTLAGMAQVRATTVISSQGQANQGTVQGYLPCPLRAVHLLRLRGLSSDRSRIRLCQQCGWHPLPDHWRRVRDGILSRGERNMC